MREPEDWDKWSTESHVFFILIDSYSRNLGILMSSQEVNIEVE